MSHAESDSCVLIITKEIDSTTDHVMQRMNTRNIPCFRLDTEKFETVKIALQFPDVHNSILSLDEVDISISKIRGVWLRRLSKPSSSRISDPDARAFAEGELDFSLRWLIALLGNYCPILDSEIKVLKGRNKFDQLAIAKNFGLRIPATLITNDPEVARSFVNQHQKAVVKSVGGYGKQTEGGFYAAYTNIITDDILQRFESIRLAPVCLQEYIEKKFELRVTVAGSQVFACRIDSQNTKTTNIDWRHYDDATPHSIYPIDPSFSQKLIKMMQRYDIRFASFDLIVTPDDSVVFLEMNPATQFLWIEKLTGMPITDAIIDEILV